MPLDRFDLHLDNFCLRSTVKDTSFENSQLASELINLWLRIKVRLHLAFYKGRNK